MSTTNHHIDNQHTGAFSYAKRQSRQQEAWLVCRRPVSRIPPQTLFPRHSFETRQKALAIFQAGGSYKKLCKNSQYSRIHSSWLASAASWSGPSVQNMALASSPTHLNRKPKCFVCVRKKASPTTLFSVNEVNAQQFCSGFIRISLSSRQQKLLHSSSRKRLWNDWNRSGRRSCRNDHIRSHSLIDYLRIFADK